MANVMNVETRTKSGKGAARQARREGKIPAVIYGAGKEATTISLTQHTLLMAVNAGGFMSHVHTLKIDDNKEVKVLTRDMQRHPVTGQVEHIDFLRFDPNKKIHVSVPVRIVDEDKSEGVKIGGVVSLLRNEIEVVCAPDSIPEFLEVSVAGLGVGEAAHASSINLPKGVEFAIADRDFTVANILTTRSAKEDDSSAEASAEGAETSAEGEEASAE